MPNLALDIVELVLLALSVVCAVYWGVVAVQIVRMGRSLPTARDGIAIADAQTPSRSVCVIVPAHNEAGNIATLIRSLKEQDYDRLHVVLALDRCTDDTAGVAREAIDDDHRFEIIEIEHCPEDWAGKVHAAHSGFTRSKAAAQSDVLIFTDADTWFDPSCVRATLALARDRDLGMLSLLSTLTSVSWFERLVQPAAAFELARQFPLERVNRADATRRAFANGQFMLFTRDCYERVGGHGAVRHALLEDIAFAQSVKKHDLRGGLFMADGMLKCGMYPDWSAFIRGWKRIYTESANREVRRLRRYARRVPVVNAALPIAALVCVVLSLALGDPTTRVWGASVGAAGVLGWLSAMVMLYRTSHAPISDIPGFVVGSVLVARIFREAADDLAGGTPTQWGGKSYVRRAAGG